MAEITHPMTDIRTLTYADSLRAHATNIEKFYGALAKMVVPSPDMDRVVDADIASLREIADALDRKGVTRSTDRDVPPKVNDIEFDDANNRYRVWRRDGVGTGWGPWEDARVHGTHEPITQITST